MNLAANCLAGQYTGIAARAKSEFYTGILEFGQVQAFNGDIGFYLGLLRRFG